jgi:hypothetical protein
MLRRGDERSFDEHVNQERRWGKDFSNYVEEHFNILCGLSPKAEVLQ